MRPRVRFYRGGRARCGHDGCRERIGKHDTISGYVITTCPRCGRFSAIFGAHGYAGVIALTEEQRERYGNMALTVAEFLADVGVIEEVAA